MKIFTDCVNCSEEITASTRFDTRGEHAMRAGEFIEVKCLVCNTEKPIPIDDFKARTSKSIKVLALVTFIITLLLALAIFLWLYYEKSVLVVYYGMFGIPFLIYGSLLAYDRNRVSSFNRLYAKR